MREFPRGNLRFTKVFQWFPWIVTQETGIASQAKIHPIFRSPIQLAEKLDFTKVFNGFRFTVACPSFGVTGPAWQNPFSTRFYKGLLQSCDLQGEVSLPLPVCSTCFRLPQPSARDMVKENQ